MSSAAAAPIPSGFASANANGIPNLEEIQNLDGMPNYTTAGASKFRRTYKMIRSWPNLVRQERKTM